VVLLKTSVVSVYGFEARVLNLVKPLTLVRNSVSRSCILESGVVYKTFCIANSCLE
jgi:hypothetical protein